MYPFGLAPNGPDAIAPTGDDVTFGMTLGAPFTFFGISYPSLFPSTNGLIAFGGRNNLFDNVAFPTSSGVTPVIAPWWSDGSTGSKFAAMTGYAGKQLNSIYYRVSYAVSDRLRLAGDVSAALLSEPPLNASSVAIVTWFANAHFGGETALNTYQVALGTDAASGRSYVTMCFDNMVWSSPTDAPFNPTYATVGFNANDGIHSYSLPGSKSQADKLLSCGGSVTNNGCYTFRVDELTIRAGSA